MNTPEQILNIALSEKENLVKLLRLDGKKFIKHFDNFKKHEINALLFNTIETPLHLCKLLKVSYVELVNLINHPVYNYYLIRKEKGGRRKIYAPANHLKKAQKTINYYLQAYYLCIKPSNVFGFVINPHYMGKYCNIAENASVHTNKKFVLNIDLKDFFPSISAKQVKKLFSSPIFNFDEQISTAITLLTTYKGKLPTGAPTSPVISNFVCLQLDADLMQFSEANGLSYSRYADDMSFSSDCSITKDFHSGIAQIIEKNGFIINEKKYRLKSSNRRQIVTGLTVNTKVNVSRKLLKKIRAMLHDLTKNGINRATINHFNLCGEPDVRSRAMFIHRLEGFIDFVGQVRGKNDLIYIKLKEGFDRIFNPAKFYPNIDESDEPSFNMKDFYANLKMLNLGGHDI